ncbi:hypothetical protein V8J82_22290 [Gymnodinialimonas sp. 2305UL16-5]|uniref:hypothetical protein n=1 Tax=Gymnodinialimonas mytili TaxID=3126503 RepID=UPI0030AF0AFE
MKANFARTIGFLWNPETLICIGHRVRWTSGEIGNVWFEDEHPKTLLTDEPIPPVLDESSCSAH